MYNLCNRSYIAARICSLAEDIKEHCALVDEDIKIIRACINEIEGANYIKYKLRDLS